MNSDKKPSSGIAPWIAWDFIKSILIINGSLYFSVWITQKQGVSSFWYGFTFAISTVLLLIVLPIKGAALDRHGIGHHLLFWLSILFGVSAIVLRQVGHLENLRWRITGTLVIFGAINFFYQASLVPYNWLLVRLRGVKTSQDVRKISGLGVSFGSLGDVVGAILGVVILSVFLKSDSDAYIDLFLWLGLLFIGLFVVDYLLLRRGIELRKGDDSERLKDLLRVAFSMLRTKGPLRNFLWSFLFFADALLTVQLYIPIFMRERLHLSDFASSAAIAVSLTGGAVGASIFAFWGRNRDLRRIILAILGAWAATLVLFGFVENKSVFLALMIWAGILYGGLWSASRAYVIEITPEDKLGRTFGFYAVFERCASIVGPLVWGSIMFLPLAASLRYIAAFSTMSLLIVLSILILALTHNASSVLTPTSDV